MRSHAPQLSVRSVPDRQRVTPPMAQPPFSGVQSGHAAWFQMAQPVALSPLELPSPVIELPSAVKPQRIAVYSAAMLVLLERGKRSERQDEQQQQDGQQQQRRGAVSAAHLMIPKMIAGRRHTKEQQQIPSIDCLHGGIGPYGVPTLGAIMPIAPPPNIIGLPIICWLPPIIMAGGGSAMFTCPPMLTAPPPVGGWAGGSGTESVCPAATPGGTTICSVWPSGDWIESVWPATAPAGTTTSMPSNQHVRHVVERAEPTPTSPPIGCAHASILHSLPPPL